MPSKPVEHVEKGDRSPSSHRRLTPEPQKSPNALRKSPIVAAIAFVGGKVGAIARLRLSPAFLGGFASAIASTATLASYPSNPLGRYLYQEFLDVQPLATAAVGATLLDLSAEAAIVEVPIPRPLPEIHDYARKAKVPVFMYHDILPRKEVFFDVTPRELRADFEFLRRQEITPVSLDDLVLHLRTGAPLPEKPVLLSFDDGYGGHYEYVYPLLKEYSYPATFAIYTNKMELKGGRTSVTWEQLQEMAADPLVTLTSHSISHPNDLRELNDEDLDREVFESKQILEERLGIEIKYFTYPVGKSDDRVRERVAAAGYIAGLSMKDGNTKFANNSEDLLQIARFGQSRLEQVSPQAWGGYPLPRADGGFNFSTPIRRQRHRVGRHEIMLITGGRPLTIHDNTRDQVQNIIRGTEAIAAVDGTFFSLRYLTSNKLFGPALSSISRNEENFIPGDPGENPLLANRPLVLIGPESANFVPFDPDRHNTMEGLQAELAAVTDAFVGAAWLVREGEAQPRESFGKLYGFDAYRFRAFWGINLAGQPVVGASMNPIDSVSLGKVLEELGFRDAIMLDSGASTSLVYRGDSQMIFTPRPVPHVVALFAPSAQ